MRELFSPGPALFGNLFLQITLAQRLFRFLPLLSSSIDTPGDVVTKQLIADVALPARRKRAAQIADHHLVEYNAERVNVGLGRRRLAFMKLRGHVQPGAGPRGFL